MFSILIGLQFYENHTFLNIYFLHIKILNQKVI